jgi:hypothetical protein
LKKYNALWTEPGGRQNSIQGKKAAEQFAAFFVFHGFEAVFQVFQGSFKAGIIVLTYDALDTIMITVLNQAWKLMDNK